MIKRHFFLIVAAAELTKILVATALVHGQGLWRLPIGEDQLRPSYGRGIWYALFGVAAPAPR